ncbi:MAG: PQQ-binding-like beta-propeller repeat protein [Planctomycetes bacterium]|nr:PQQ-binding-like beta-propeller repeat protein [Planctomycetota bacterium]
MRYLPMLLVLAIPANTLAAPPDVWPGFRGTGDSISEAKQLPLKWSATENIAWTAELPGFGQSSPVVWKDKVFVTSVEGEFKDTLHVLCFDLATGKEKWKKTFAGAIKVKTSDYVSKGAPTPIATADRVVALFETGDLFALDHDGKELWQRSLVKDFGNFSGQHGLGTSPVLAGDAVLVLVAQAKSPYLLAVDAGTGKDRWRTEDNFGSSWSSPTVVKVGDTLTALVSSSGLAAGFDVKTGKRLWEVDGLKGNTVASPTAFGDLALMGSSDKTSQMVVRLDGEVAAEKRIAWRSTSATSSFGSPLVYKDLAYSVSREGNVVCLDPKTGKEHWDTRLPASCWASPIGGAGRVYFFTRDGVCIVAKAGNEFEQLAENKLPAKGKVYGVAVVENAFIVRTESAIVRIGK